MQLSSNQRFLKYGAFLFNFIVLIVGPTLLALSLRVLFDPEFTHLFFQDGNYYAGHILVAIGALMTVVGILGCIGTLAENSCLLWMFFASMGVFLIAEITGGVLIYHQQNELQNDVHNSIRVAVERHYGNDVTDSLKLDVIQEGWKCCGTTGYKSWSRSEYGKRPMSRDFIATGATYVVPKSCCIDQSSTDCDRVSFLEGIRGEDQSKVLYQEGCGKKLVEAISTYARYTFVTITIVAIVQIVAMILTALFAVAIRRGDASRFTSRQGLNSSYASAPMLSNSFLFSSAESTDTKRHFNVSSSSVSASRSSLNLEPVIVSKGSSLV
ncbi:leukocyte surface antigen CD53-like isoform X1 [Daphnia carinata]|uniref:leukocyte surface antigen CD53-like isoform X1 n=1 Tax=Daphnia carinata TaxID=120202 RepID=UPI002869247F|nr:leukocyte surface antigen CD53-like isoform X1 [Daphnia carinata]